MAYNIIVAESSPSIQKSIQMAFSDEEFEIHYFTDGAELMKSSSQIHPDAILLSLSLPIKDGYEVGFHLKRQERLKNTPLILLKGAFDPLDRKKMAGLDFVEIVEEPFDSDGLVQKVRNLIEGSKHIQTLPEESAIEGIHDPDSDHDLLEKDALKEMPFQDTDPSSENALASFPPEWEAYVKEIVRDFVKEEILDMERELEKRIKAQILIELKRGK